MIITKKKDKEQVLKSLDGVKSVYLIGCGACAEQCRTGGPAEVEEMSAVLTGEGFEVLGTSLVDETCYKQLVRKEFRSARGIKDAEAIVVLACGAGVKTVAENADTLQVVLPALDTTFLASVERQGRFFEGCSMCGECVLAATAGICPHTDCPKALLNGPCGGVADGKCEVNTDNECAWVRIYERLKAQDRLRILKDITLPKDHSGSTRPRVVLLR